MFKTFLFFMNISTILPELLCCPDDKSALSLITSTELEQINAKILKEGLRTRDGRPVKELIEAGLLRADGKYLYPIRDSTPVMLIEEAISMDDACLV